MQRAILLLLVPFLVVPLAQAQESVTNQRLFDTDPFLPQHYDNRVARFEAEPVVQGRVLFLGDSITEGGPWRELTGDTTVVNRGISGDVTFGVLKRLDDVVRRRPSKLFLMIGINDIGKDIPEEVIADNIRQIVERIQAESPATVTYLQSLLPLNSTVDQFPQHYDKENHVVRANRLLREVARAADIRYVNLSPLFFDREERLDAQLTGDGLHLNRAGYEIWVRHLLESGFL